MDTHYTAINYISEATCCSCILSHSHTHSHNKLFYICTNYMRKMKWSAERNATEFSVINFTFFDRQLIKPFFRNESSNKF